MKHPSAYMSAGQQLAMYGSGIVVVSIMLLCQLKENINYHEFLYVAAPLSGYYYSVKVVTLV